MYIVKNTLRKTYKEHSPISSGEHGPSLMTAVAPNAPHIRLNSNFDIILITIKPNLSRKCIAISEIDPLHITEILENVQIIISYFIKEKVEG